MSYRMLAEQIQEVRRRIREPNASSINNRQIISLLNQGAYVSCRDLGVYYKDIFGFSSVANQQEYNIPDDFITSNNLIFSPWISHTPMVELEYSDLTNPFPLTGTDPRHYAFDRANKKLFIRPIPTASAQTTTLNGSLSAVATSITVVSTTGFGTQGRIAIESEVIQYTGLTATTFTGCTRGVDGTTAASHSTAVTVTWRNFLLYYQRGPALLKTSYITGTVAITTATTAVTGVATNWLSGQNVYAGNYIGIGAYEAINSSETFPMKWYKIASVDSVTGITLDSAFAEPTVSAGSTYIITDKSELMEAETELPILFTEIQIYHILGNTEKKNLAREAYAYEMQEAEKRMISPDYLPTVRTCREALIQSTGMPRFGSFYPEVF